MSKHFVIAIVLLSGCKSTKFPIAQLRHDFGQITIDYNLPRMKCGDLPLKEYFPISNDYVAKVAQSIIEAHSDTFVGSIDASSFCFDVPYAVNAKAYPSHNLVRVGSQTILDSSSDAELAATLAHEIAHITRYHLLIRPEPANAELRNEWKTLYDRWRKIYPQFDRNDTIAKMHGREVTDWQTEFQFRVSDKNPSDHKRLLDLYEQRYSINQPETGGLFLGGDPESNKLSDLDQQIDQILLTVASDLEWKYFTHQRSLAESAAQLLSRFQSEILDLDERLYNIEIKSMDPSERWIWDERDADEVGYEMYMRSRFNYLSYTTWMDNDARVEIYTQNNLQSRQHNRDYQDSLPKAQTLTRKDRDELIAECIKSIKDNSQWEDSRRSSVGGYLPPCKRIYNIWIKERSDHAKEYEALTKNANIDFLPGNPTLIQAQQEIKSWVKKHPHAAFERL